MRSKINDRGADDANIRGKIPAAGIGARYESFSSCSTVSGIQQAGFPERHTGVGIRIGVKRVNGIALGGDEDRVVLIYEIPLGEIIVDFYDQLKSRTQGYASLDYQLKEYRPADLVNRYSELRTVAGKYPAVERPW